MSSQMTSFEFHLTFAIKWHPFQTNSSVVAVLDLVSIQSKDKEQGTSIPRPSLLKVKQYDFLRIQQGILKYIDQLQLSYNISVTLLPS